MPDFCFLLPETSKVGECDSFAFIPSSRGEISLEEIFIIAHTRGLKAIAVILFKESDKEFCEKIRATGIECVFPASFEEFALAVRGCGFVITERLHGAIFSLLSHTPAYVSTDTPKNRAIIAECKARSDAPILLEYSINSVVQKKEIGSIDSDFNYVVNSLRADISDSLNLVF